MSKCDFILKYSGRLVSQPPDLRRPLQFDFQVPQIPMSSLSSSKCDWRVRGTGLELAGVEDRIESLEGRFGPGSIGMTASKCDWRVRVAGAKFAGVTRPDVQTSLAASKCDFKFQIEVTYPRGPGFRVSAAGSSKCDFRIGDILQRARGDKDWRPVGPAKS